jgi:hypothetical protein
VSELGSVIQVSLDSIKFFVFCIALKYKMVSSSWQQQTFGLVCQDLKIERHAIRKTQSRVRNFLPRGRRHAPSSAAGSPGALGSVGGGGGANKTG